jgi:hypothetical protein
MVRYVDLGAHYRGASPSQNGYRFLPGHLPGDADLLLLNNPYNDICAADRRGDEATANT